VRLFLALEVPGAVRDAVDAAVGPLRQRYPGLRWTRPDAWHLTVAFLGEVGERVAVSLHGALEPVAGSVGGPIALRVTEPGRFGARVLWLGLSDRPEGTVAGLGERLQAAAADAGIAVDRKQVRPHLTLARGRDPDARVTQTVVAACPVVDASWEVGEVLLVRSHLGGGPARYETLAALPLGASDPG